MIDYAKANPGKLNYGSVGIGSSQHLAGEYFSQVTGVKITHVPYRNIAQYGPDLMAGTVQLGFQWYPNVAGPIQAKGANPLAVAGDNRLPVIAGHADHQGSRPARIQDQRLVRAARAQGHAEADPGEAEQGSERRAEGPGRQGGVREGRRRYDRRAARARRKKFHRDEIVKYRDIITKAGI